MSYPDPSHVPLDKRALVEPDGRCWWGPFHEPYGFRWYLRRDVTAAGSFDTLSGTGWRYRLDREGD